MQDRGHKPVQEELPRGSEKRAHPSVELRARFPVGDSMAAT